MASERSLYEKVKHVLRVAEGLEVETVQELVATVEEEGTMAFLSLQYDYETDEYVWRQSRRAIRRCVGMCLKLGLVDETGTLTTYGKRARRRESDYRSVLGERIMEVMTDAGITTSLLNDTSQGLLRSGSSQLPTSLTLWETLEPNVGKAEFSRLLTLLADAGYAETRQSKLFLGFRG